MSSPEDWDGGEDAAPPPPIEGMFTDLARARKKPPKWVIKDLLPVGMSITIGPPKVSQKSTLAMAMAALTAGLRPMVLPPFLSQVERTGPVLGFSSEASAGELRSMVEDGMHLKLEPGHILIADDPGVWRLDDPNGIQRLLHWIQLLDPRMVLIDVLRDFHDLDEKESAEMSRMLRPLRKWAHASESALLVVHHTRKLAEGREKYSFEDARGSSALFGMCDGIHIISPKEDGTKVVQGIFKRGEGWEYRLQFGTWDKTAREHFDTDELKVIKFWNEKQPPNSEDLARGVGLSKSYVLRVLAKGKRNGMLTRQDKEQHR